MISKYILSLKEISEISGKNRSEVEEYIYSEKKDAETDCTNKNINIEEKIKLFFKEQSVDYSFRVISHINLRGGVGKTTCAVTLASRAKQFGFKTCIIDIDSQASSSLAYNIILEEDDPVFYDIWQRPSELVMSSLRKIENNIFILPSSLQNGLLDLSLMNPVSQKKAVKDVCGVLKNNGFELIIIDCPPSLGAAVISSICASNIIVIPVCSDIFSVKGIEMTSREIKSICDTFSIPHPIIKILYMKYDKREKNSIDTLAILKNKYTDTLIPTQISTSVLFNKCFSNRETIFANRAKNRSREEFDFYARNILNFFPLKKIEVNEEVN